MVRKIIYILVILIVGFIIYLYYYNAHQMKKGMDIYTTKSLETLHKAKKNYEKIKKERDEVFNSE